MEMPDSAAAHSWGRDVQLSEHLNLLRRQTLCRRVAAALCPACPLPGTLRFQYRRSPAITLRTASLPGLFPASATTCQHPQPRRLMTGLYTVLPLSILHLWATLVAHLSTPLLSLWPMPGRLQV